MKLFNYDVNTVFLSYSDDKLKRFKRTPKIGRSTKVIQIDNWLNVKSRRVIIWQGSSRLFLVDEKVIFELAKFLRKNGRRC